MVHVNLTVTVRSMDVTLHHQEILSIIPDTKSIRGNPSTCLITVVGLLLQDVKVCVVIRLYRVVNVLRRCTNHAYTLGNAFFL
jgi:hypothetical protein